MARTLPRPVTDFEAVIRAISRQRGEPVVLVGGHAVNVWANTFQSAIGDRLKPHGALMSGDMDVYGTRGALLSLHKDLGGKLRLGGPREIIDGTIIMGEEPDTRDIGVLRTVNGLPSIEAKDTVILRVCGYDIPVLFPHLLLQGKLENALHLDQEGRQDVKHVKIMALVLPEFIKFTLESARLSREKDVLKLLQDALKILTSENAREFSKRHGLDFREAMPPSLFATTSLPRIAKFGKEQLDRAFPAASGSENSGEQRSKALKIPHRMDKDYRPRPPIKDSSEPSI